MAINKRTYPNDYFAWYNDDSRLAIVSKDTTNDSSDRTSEKYDSFQGDGDLSGTITASSTVAGSFVDLTSASHGLAVNDRVTISGTTSYNGNHAVTAIGVGGNTFRIAATNSESSETGTWVSLFINDGLRITYHAKYESVSAQSHDLQTAAGVDSGLHPAIVCFVKARLYEDQGDMERAMYFRRMYEKAVMQYPSRKSGVRVLAVPHM